MANPAQEEADRYLSARDATVSHPEDRDDVSDRSAQLQEEEKPRQRNLRGGARNRASSLSDEDLDEDNDNSHKMATMTTSRTNNYTLPNTTHFANTGPKGVIADAQNFHRAKKSSFRNRLSTFAGSFASFKPPSSNVFSNSESKKDGNSSDHSGNLSEEDSDTDFMANWRAQRMQELTAQGSGYNSAGRRVSPSRRTWGALTEVDANGYLDAIEKVSPEDVVVVMIYDPTSNQSAGVEDELNMLAYRHSKTRFVKLHHEIAEMETVQIPTILAYKEGDVFATISGAQAQDVEEALRRNRVIV